MADQLTPQERLQPALLDRLTDDEPDKKLEPREQRVLSKSRLRQAVLRDLAWLFNTTRLESGDLAGEVPHAAAIGGQLRPARALRADGLDARRSRTSSGRLKQAILDFEPRILPETLEVRALVELSELDHHNVIGVEIHGQLWAQPVPLELLIRTEIDLETGKVQIADLAPSRVG